MEVWQPMLNIRKTVLTGLAVVAIGAVWNAKSIAQEKSSVGIVTVFDHEKLDASFAKAFSNGGSNLLWSHTSSKGTYNVDTHSRESAKAAVLLGGGVPAAVHYIGHDKVTAVMSKGGQIVNDPGLIVLAQRREAGL